MMDGSTHEANSALNKAARNVRQSVADLWVDLMEDHQDVPLMNFAESDLRQARDMISRILERNRNFKRRQRAA